MVLGFVWGSGLESGCRVSSVGFGEGLNPKPQ